jgi:hypothetical protein
MGHLSESDARDVALKGDDDGPESTSVEALNVTGYLDHVAGQSTAKACVAHAQIIGGALGGRAR